MSNSIFTLSNLFAVNWTDPPVIVSILSAVVAVIAAVNANRSRQMTQDYYNQVLKINNETLNVQRSTAVLNHTKHYEPIANQIDKIYSEIISTTVAITTRDEGSEAARKHLEMVIPRINEIRNSIRGLPLSNEMDNLLVRTQDDIREFLKTDTGGQQIVELCHQLSQSGESLKAACKQSQDQATSQFERTTNNLVK